MSPLMTIAELEAYVRRAMSGTSRRHGITTDEAIRELREGNMINRAQEEAVRYAILISNDGT